VERSFKIETAFRARPRDVQSKGGEGPNVAVLCEYDALPEIGHACGHNLIATVGVAASLGIQAALQSSEFDGSGKVSHSHSLTVIDFGIILKEIRPT